MKLRWENTLLYNEQGNDGGTGSGDAVETFAAWGDGDMTDGDESSNADSGEEGSDGDNGEEEGSAGDGASDNQEAPIGGDSEGSNEKADDKGDGGESSSDNSQTEEVKPEELLAEITARDENKDKTPEELQEILANELDSKIESDVLGGEAPLEENVAETTTFNWGEQAKALGLVDEVSEDFTQDKFKEAIDSKIQSEVSAVKEEYSTYDGLGSEAKNFVHHLDAYGIDGIKQYLDPVASYDKYLNMDKESLVEANLRATLDENDKPYYSEEQIADKMLSYEDTPDLLQKDYDQIKLGIISARKESISDIARRMEADRQERDARSSAPIYNPEETFNHVKSMEQFVGVNVGKGASETIAKMIEKGEVEKLMKDPKFLAKSLMFHKFGEDAIKSIRTTEFQKGKNRSLAKQYNVPSINGGNPGAGGQAEAPKTGTFKDWGDE